MRHIKKNTEPTTFADWKRSNATLLQQKYTTETAQNIWNWFGTFSLVRDDLRLHLAKEQGGICCYCGQDITTDSFPTAIEHFIPKSIDTANTIFDYNNLMLSCKCSELHTPSVIKFKKTFGYETLITQRDIATKAGCSTKKIREWNTDLEQDPRKEIKKEKGDDINLYIKHCDDKKENMDIRNPINEIISPFAANCADFFDYESNGGITIKNQPAHIQINTLDKILNLNATNLCELRTQTYAAAIILKNKLENDFGGGLITDDELIWEIEHQEDLNENAHRTPFCFIYTYLLKQLY